MVLGQRCRTKVVDELDDESYLNDRDAAQRAHRLLSRLRVRQQRDEPPHQSHLGKREGRSNREEVAQT